MPEILLNASEVSHESQIFYICQSYLFFHLYDNVNIPHLAAIFAFANVYGVLSDSHNYFTFGSHIFFQTWDKYEFPFFFKYNLF